MSALGLANNLYTQIGLVLLIALSAKNAILIVEVARDRRRSDNLPIVAAAVEAARTRFRPIVMTSFAFILGVVPLVLSTGAGAAARISLGLSVLTGMIASTCLAVLFVPSFFVVLQGLEERRQEAAGRNDGASGGGVMQPCHCEKRSDAATIPHGERRLARPAGDRFALAPNMKHQWCTSPTSWRAEARHPRLAWPDAA